MGAVCLIESRSARYRARVPPWIESISTWADEFQQRHAILGFPYAVVKKYGDDQAGRSAALVAYYSFVALFPLLLVLVTLSDIFLQDRPDLQKKLLESAFAQIPVIGDQLSGQVAPLSATGPALIVGVLAALWAARGMASAMIDGANNVWNVPFVDRPAFPARYGRIAGLTLTISLGLISATALSGLATAAPKLFRGAALGVFGSPGLTFALATSFTAAVFLLSFRIALSSVIPTRELWRGAILGAIAWQGLQLLGSFIITRTLETSSAIYGTFTLVIGTIAYLSLAATATHLALEVDAVRAKQLWPRTLIGVPALPGDVAALQGYVDAQRRFKEQTIEVGTTSQQPPPDRDAKPAAGSDSAADEGRD